MGGTVLLSTHLGHSTARMQSRGRNSVCQVEIEIGILQLSRSRLHYRDRDSHGIEMEIRQNIYKNFENEQVCPEIAKFTYWRLEILLKRKSVNIRCTNNAYLPFEHLCKKTKTS